MSKLILGVGTNSRGKYKAKHNGKITKSHSTWRQMLRRCYCPKYQDKFPAYIGCSVDSEWHEFQAFAEWHCNHDYSAYGYDLDKDILLPGNKVYSSDRVCFVPTQINSLLLSNPKIRGKYKQGVCFDKTRSKFMASMKVDGRFKYLGRFDSELEAYQVYKTAKEANVKRMALEWRDLIAPNVFDALMNWRLQ